MNDIKVWYDGLNGVSQIIILLLFYIVLWHIGKTIGKAWSKLNDWLDKR